MSSHLLLFKKQIQNQWHSFVILRPYLGIETIFCRLLLPVARMEMDAEFRTLENVGPKFLIFNAMLVNGTKKNYGKCSLMKFV